MKISVRALISFSVTIVTAIDSAGAGSGAVAAGEAKVSPAPVFENLGNHTHRITTSENLAQRYFDQGLVLMYGFNHAEAIRSFKAAAVVDPECAMAYWGIAYALGPNINAPMETNAVPAAWKALQQALARRDRASVKERAYIDALARRYRPDPVEDRSDLDRAYADAMREVASAYPDDPDAAALFVEALLDTMPWDYWTAELKPKPATGEVLRTLRNVLRRDPDHPGANHFYIHAVEAGPEPEIGIPSADRLGSVAPGAGHLVHMPSHIYARVGQYRQATEANKRAVVADRSYITQCRTQGFYPGTYYPHNVHFLWYTEGLEGRSAGSIAAADQVAAYALDNVCGPSAAVEAPRFRHLPLLARARFGRWVEVVEAPLPEGAPELTLDRALTHYAWGIAWAARGGVAKAEAEQLEFERLVASDELKALENPYFPANGIAEVARHVLAGKVLGAGGNTEAMVTELERGVAAQDALPYMEPPYWYYPVRQSLGAALLKARRFAEAEAVFREDLKDLPRNGWGLFGLAESLRGQGKVGEAENVAKEFEAAWARADVKLDLSWF